MFHKKILNLHNAKCYSSCSASWQQFWGALERTWFKRSSKFYLAFTLFADRIDPAGKRTNLPRTHAEDLFLVFACSFRSKMLRKYLKNLNFFFFDFHLFSGPKCCENIRKTFNFCLSLFSDSNWCSVLQSAIDRWALSRSQIRHSVKKVSKPMIYSHSKSSQI